MNLTTETITPDTNDIIRKIQKLLALGQSPNEAEAALAMARAQTLLAKYNLDCAMVTETHVAGGTVGAPEEKREKTRISRSAQYRWQRDIWKAIAEANFCWHSIVEVFEGKRGKGTSKVRVKRHMILGRESNVIAVRLMGEYLEDTMERILPYPNSERLSRAAISWKTGCAARLIERIEQQAEERKQADVRPAGESTALVLLRDVYQREYAANYDFRYGAGAHARRLLQDAEWQQGQAAREERARIEQEKKEKEWLEYLQNESPEQKRAREKKEANERLRQERAWERQTRSWERERIREASRLDRSAYRSGRSAAESINIGAQVKETEKGKQLG